MTREERLTLRDILHDFKAGNVEQDYVEAHVECLIEDAVVNSEHKAALRGSLKENPPASPHNTGAPHES